MDSHQSRQSSEEDELPDYDTSLRKKDFFPKIFLIPSQVRLEKDKGLVVIKRTNQHPDKYEEQDIKDIAIHNVHQPGQPIYEQSNHNPAGHGLLSLFKRSSNRKIRLAICVCVYSEPKHMLKSTIKGIQESYKHFYQKAGIMSHEIVLVVIFDGIEKVNCSKDQTENMINYFNEWDLKNGFRHKPYGKSVQEYIKQVEDDIENYDDISVFTEKQLNDLKGKLFETQYNEFTRIKKLQSEIVGLKTLKEIKVDQLPIEVYKKYEQLSLNYCIQNNVTCVESRDEIQEYLSTKKQLRLKLIIEAVREMETLCSRYLESRKDKAILYPIRMQASDMDDLRKQNSKKEQAKSQNMADLNQDKKDYQYMFFCVKHTNGGKLSSHLLFFEGFCKTIDPQFCILLDVGLKPKGDALYKMWSYMQKNKKCGGVCGYMGLDIENPADDLGYRADGFDVGELDSLTKAADMLFNLQRAQQFEYHFAHMLDKPFEACFNYVHVLPGAFSGYRWKALQSIKYESGEQKIEEVGIKNPITEARNFSRDGEDNENLLLERPEQNTLMKKYLKTAMGDQLDLTLQESNMYLAQDRVMCLGIHALGYDLAYLPDAQSTVDPVTSLTKMMGQRRRWINGSWFAFEYVFKHRKQRPTFSFVVQLLYYWLVQRITYISIALFYLSMTMTVSSAAREYIVPAIERFFQTTEQWELSKFVIGIFDVKSIANSIPDLINFVYVMTITGVLFLSLSLNQNNKRFSRLYYLTSSLLGFYGCCIFILLVVDTYHIMKDVIRWEMTNNFIIPIIYLKALILFVVVGYALPILWTLSPSKWVDMVMDLPSYIFYVPSYINVLLIYSFCRIDDLSWGTKGLEDDIERQRSNQWKKEKYFFISKFVIINVMVAFGVTQVLDLPEVRNYVILIMTCLVVFLLAFRLLFAFIYLIKYAIKSCWLRFTSDQINENIRNGRQVLQSLNFIEYQIKEIEKRETKLRKQEQFKQLKNSKIFDNLSLSLVGVKLRNRITQHIIDNNVLPKMELTDDKRKYRSRKKQPLKKKLNVIEEASNESNETGHFEHSKISESEENHDRVYVNKPLRQGAGIVGSNLDFRERLQKLKKNKGPRSQTE